MIDNDSSDGTRSAQLCIGVVDGPETNVPAETYPSIIPVQVDDNDGNYHVRYFIDSFCVLRRESSHSQVSFHILL